jgi:hypothetical protein
MGATWYEPATTLAFVAAATHWVRLLSHVLVLPYRHPLTAAKLFATLDRLSGGFGDHRAGSGHLSRSSGPRARLRGGAAMSDEYLDALATALENEVLSFTGRSSWRHDDRAAPIQTPRPPLWVGQHAGDGALAGRRGDGIRGRSRARSSSSAPPSPATRTGASGRGDRSPSSRPSPPDVEHTSADRLSPTGVRPAPTCTRADARRPGPSTERRSNGSRARCSGVRLVQPGAAPLCGRTPHLHVAECGAQHPGHRRAGDRRRQRGVWAEATDQRTEYYSAVAGNMRLGSYTQAIEGY